MELELKNRDQIVTEQATVTQASATIRIGTLLNFAVGTVLRALQEATAGIALWLQGLIVKVLSATRLSTSQNEDVDSFIADFGLERLVPVSSIGNVTFSRTLALNEAKIGIDSIVQTALTGIKFKVIADTANPNYNAPTQQYILPVGMGSSLVKVQAAVAGTGGNVDANTITVIYKPIAYIDFVNNSNPFVNGVDKESDAHVRTRFVAYINSLSKATKLAISSAIEAIQDGIEYVVVENIDYDSGLERLGYFFVVIDDGTGHPSSELLATVTNVVDRVRALTTMFIVKAAVLQTAAVSANVYINEDLYDANVVKAAIETALETYIDSMSIGKTLHYTKLIDVIYDAHVSIQNVTNVTLNGVVSDLTSDNKHSIKAGTLTITMHNI